MKEIDIVGILMFIYIIVLVGVSDKFDCFSYCVMKYLFDQGYYVILVLLKVVGKMLLGQKGYGTLVDVLEKVDMVDVFCNLEVVWGVVQEVIVIGVKIFWM